MNIRKLQSKAAYRLSNRILKLTSMLTIYASQHQYGFVPTTQSQIQI
ncbi:hypothetical protein D778_02753 [Xanthomarina gelatinilytica]|uniref:Uncharacterized protein n=1 Tax=Xanthomarina gelatinilytica TaxID=1137281 RepID=M7MJK3_9FLAO|nr:hypothetical protein D778_02753 [Xanthomarina gelatinilytica]